MTSPAPAVQVDHLGFSYGKRRVINNITWSAPDGITALMGPNGAGKTTLLRLLTGELTPSDGTILVRGKPPGPDSRIGYLPQHFSFVDRMQVWEAAAHTAWSAGVPRAEATTRALDALAAVHLDGKQHDRISSLSGGQRQRLGIACTLAPRPALLLLDEPSVGLDPIQRVSLRDLLRELGHRLPIILSTHLVDDVAELADHVLVLTEHGIAYNGDADAFTHGTTLDEAYTRAVLQAGVA